MSNQTFITTVYTSHPNHKTGGGFGVNIPCDKRDSLFKREWKTVQLHIGGIVQESVEVPLTPSFWQKCNELRNRAIGVWVIKEGLERWAKGHPSKIRVTHRGGNRFAISRV